MYSSSFIHLLLFTFFLHAQPLVSNKSIIFICIFVLNNKIYLKKTYRLQEYVFKLLNKVLFIKTKLQRWAAVTYLLWKYVTRFEPKAAVKFKICGLAR